MNGLSLRSRLLAGMGLVVVVLAIVALVITSTTRARLIDQLDDRLATSASGGRGSVFDRDDPPGGGRVGRGQDDATPTLPPERQSDFYEGEIRPDGTAEVYFPPNIGGAEFAPPDIPADEIDFDSRAKKFLTVPAQEGGIEYRALVETTGGRGDAFVTALPLDAVESTIRQLTWIVLAAVAGVVAVLGLVTWWMLRLGIRPIKQMTVTAATIAAGDLSARADESSTAVESRDLAVALNAMLATIESSIAERHRSESRLRRFVSDASHELRTPVTTIRGYAELYRVGGLTTQDELDDAMRRTEQESARMGRLVEDMLTLAKLDEQRPLRHDRVDIARLARDAVGDAQVAASERSITITAPETAVILGDDDRLRQVLANLVNNALTHTAPDVAVCVTVRDPAAGRIVIEVSDAGEGMPAEVAARITERFYRADPSRSRRHGGSGLGLAIVHAAVDAHGGTVRVASVEGEGTTVSVDLPSG